VDEQGASVSNAPTTLPPSAFAHEDDFEIVPRERTALPANRAVAAVLESEEMEVDQESSTGDDSSSIEVTEAAATSEDSRPSARTVQMAKLKDMFAPREEDVGFSVLGNMELDLELDDTLDVQAAAPLVRSFPSEQPTRSLGALHAPPPTSTTVSSTSSTSVIPLDPTRALFFPLPGAGTDLRAKASAKGRFKDVFDVIQNSLFGAPPFARTESAEEIKQKWEERRGELTREWKRRGREAGKAARRRGGGGDRE